MAKLAMFSDFTFSIPIEQRLTLIKNAGFDGVMLNYNDDDCVVKVDEQCAMCRKLGLEIACVHLRFNDGNAIWTRDSWADQLIHDLESCHRNGITIAVMHPTQGNVYPEANEQGFERIRRICSYCEQAGITLAIENKRNSDHIEKIFQAVDSPALAYCYDIGHEAIYMPRGAVIDIHNPYYPLAVLHMHDNHHTADEHMIPLDGAIDYDAVIDQLISIDYKGYILLETRKEFARMYDDMSNKQFVERAAKHAQYLYNRIHLRKQCTLD